MTVVRVTVLRRSGRGWAVHRDGALKDDIPVARAPYVPFEGALAAMFLGAGRAELVCSWAAWVQVRPAKARSGLG